MKVNPEMKSLIIEVVENQLRENNPQETKETFDRLVAKGYSESQAKEMIGTVVVEEIWGTMKQNRMFDKDKFVKKLAKLK
jgi:hypothetical protein